MDYSKLSDFEVNCKVAFHIGLKTVERAEGGEFQPCNNPADAWPIMTENKISVMWMTAEKQWCAWANGNLEKGCWEWSYCPDEYHHDDNALRAAMIVFLMMQESQHA
ncbi:phage protein NinX family protein [Cronobacter dublinensis]